MKFDLVGAARVSLTLAIVACAAVCAWILWDYTMQRPWTRDGRVRADVVQITADVSGLVAEVKVHDNQHVSQGDELFVLDRRRFELALQLADAAVADQRAQLHEALREQQRNRGLGDLVSSEIAERSDARVQQLQATLAQALAGRAAAQLNLDRTRVLATVDGWISNLELRPGDYLNAGRPVLALLDERSLHVDGYFEETKLENIHVGDGAQVRLMGTTRILRGRVDSIAHGIADRERSASGDMLANVNPTFTWVRLAQRIPVRIHLEQDTAATALIVGRTATVAITEHPPTGVRRMFERVFQ